MPDTITQSLCRPGWCGRSAELSSTSFQPTLHISTRSNDRGGLMHRHTTHNKCYATFKDFSIAMLNFLRNDVPRNWPTYCDEVTDKFRVIDPKKFRIIVSS